MSQRLPGVLFLLIGLLAAGIMWPIATSGLLTRQDWVKAEGVVVDVVASRDRSGDRLYAPVVLYEGADGPLTCQAKSRSSRQPTPGEAETVRFDPANPQDCRVGSDSWVTWLLLGLGAVFLGVFGTLGVLTLRRRVTMVQTHPGRWRLAPGRPSAAASSSSPWAPDSWETADLRRRVSELEADNARLRGDGTVDYPTNPGYPGYGPNADGGAEGDPGAGGSGKDDLR